MCVCKNAWHETSTGEIICYEENYCKFPEYKYLLDDTKQCINTGCPSNYYQFNFQCYKEGCPLDTNSDSYQCTSIYNYCYINEYFQTICSESKSDNYILNFENTVQYLQSCEESLIYTISETETYLYNGICYIECPEETNRDTENNICTCKYYGYYPENDYYICYQENENCTDKDKIPVIDIKICLNEINECISKNYKIFNNECYSDSCPENTELSSDNTYTCICSNYFYEENNLYNCFDSSITSCEEKDYLYSNPNTYECFLSLGDCTYKGNIYHYNNYCYKDGCPQNTKYNSETNNCTDIINFEITYPQEYYDNPDTCLAVYNNKCYSTCPENTCLTQQDQNLIYCVDVESYMTVFNDICFTNTEEIIKNLKNLSDSNTLLSSESGINIGVYTKDSVNNYNSSFTVVSLNECEELLKGYYNLSSDTTLYILGIETPNKDSQSSVNIYNYKVFLENGTELDYNNACSGVKLSISAIISNEDLINLQDAIYFSSFGYDIYNSSSEFYTSVCTSASINNSDITLTDRYSDFYPSNVSMCNDSCQLNYVNLNSLRIECDCDMGYNFSDSSNVEENNDKEETNLSFWEYLLTFINYKIFVCYNLFNDPNNVFKNIGFYVGFIIIIGCVINLSVFINLGIFSINHFIKENEPSKYKLEQMRIEQEEKRKKLIELFNNKTNKIEIKKKNHNQNKKENGVKVSKKYLNESKKENNPPKKISEINSENMSSKNCSISKGKEKPQKYKKAKSHNILSTFSNKKNIKHQKDINNLLYLSISKNDNNSISKLNTKKIKSNIVQTVIPKNKKFFSLEKLDRKKEIKETESVPTHKKLNLEKFSNYQFLIKLKESSIEKKELNEATYDQAMRLDTRPIHHIFLYVLANKIDIIDMLFYFNPYVHLSISITLYIFSILLDVTLNCFLYTDDAVSEKYHNNGHLETATSLLLSFMSNIFSSIICYIVETLSNYSDAFEIIINESYKKKVYYRNMIKFKKLLKIKVTFLFVVIFILCILMTYYISIFCTIYQTTQINIMINYLYGVLESFAISVGISLIITMLRYFSIKYKKRDLYYTSRFLYQKF